MNVDARPYFMTLEYWEDLLCKLNEMRRYRRIVGSLAGSCLSAAIPLLSSTKETACLVALDIVEVFSFSVRTMRFNKLKLRFLFHSFTWKENITFVIHYMACLFHVLALVLSAILSAIICNDIPNIDFYKLGRYIPIQYCGIAM